MSGFVRMQVTVESCKLENGKSIADLNILRRQELEPPHNYRRLIRLFDAAILVSLMTLLIYLALSLVGATAYESVKPATRTATAATMPLPPNPSGLLRWNNLPVHYCVDENSNGFIPNSQFVILVEQAFDAWGVPAVNDGPCSGTPRQRDGVNEIGWGVVVGQHQHNAKVYETGVAWVRSVPCGRECEADHSMRLAEVDILINNQPPEFQTEECTFSTLLHETGHFLGIDHLQPTAIMAAQTSTCSQVLTSADLDALHKRYGDAVQAAHTP